MTRAINKHAYVVWVAVKKDLDSNPGGEIFRAYCSCSAGMLGSCNHIAGVLFRIEHAVKTGLTNPKSTSKPCIWNTPKLKTRIQPGKIVNFCVEKGKIQPDCFNRKGN